jgi:L-lactate dehydrogenase complex protein LldE
MERVFLFIPCLVDSFLPEIGVATATILSRVGYSVHYDPRQTCCGQPLINAGRIDEAKDIASRFVDIFSDADYIVSPSGSCVHTVIHHYPGILSGDREKKRAREIAEKTYELSYFLARIAQKHPPDMEFPHSVTYHHSCHILRGLGIMDEPLELLGAVSGIELLPLPDADVCCGFGGEFSTTYSAVSEALVTEKVKKALSVGAEYLVLAEPGCLLNIRGYVTRHNLPLTVLHLAQVLAGGHGGTR